MLSKFVKLLKFLIRLEINQGSIRRFFAVKQIVSQISEQVKSLIFQLFYPI